MNIENLEHLKDALKYRGFGESLNKDLEQQMQKGTAEFQLVHGTKINNDDVGYRLHFRKDDVADKYYFNKFDTILMPADRSRPAIEHTFYADQHITAKEAYNLLSYGQKTAVYKGLYNKENQPYNAWITLDLTGQKDKNNNYPLIKYHDSYYKKQPFELKDALSKLPVPVKELSGKYADNIERALKRGNAVNVTIMLEGKEESALLLVNAKAGRVDVYSEGMKLITGMTAAQEAKQRQAPPASTIQQDDVKKKSENQGQQVNWNRNSQNRGMRM